MGRLFSLVNVCLMLFMLIQEDVSQVNTRANSPYKHTKASDRDTVEIHDPISTRWLSEQDNIMEDFFRGRRHSYVNKDFRKRDAFVLPYSGELIRLRSHAHFVHSGLVEVYKDGKWGYVCDGGWDLTDADVACKELGFTMGAISASSTYGTLSESERSSASVLINDIQCSGTESSLHECPYSLLNICSSDKIAGVTCNQDMGCPHNFILGFDKCYKFYTNAKAIEDASSICAGDNASLVRIDSVKENHFLSNILQTSMPHIYQWYTGGRKIRNKWQWWTPVVYNNGENLEEENRQEITINKWFPGWPSFNDMDAEPTRKKGYRCLTLSNVYKHPLTKSSIVVDYFYWKANPCRSPSGMNFICQMTARRQDDDVDKDCYTEDGSSYRGTAAVTEDGEPCQKWSLSPTINEETYSEKGLGDHNYCRNPNNDSQPWCWVDHELGTYGVCELSKCSVMDIPTGSSSLNLTNAEVDLLGGEYGNKSDVEVVVDNKRYGICYANWNPENAAAMCKMLGFSSGGIATNHSYAGVYPNNTALNFIDCNGIKWDWSKCSVTVYDSESYCSVDDLTWIICTNKSKLIKPLEIKEYDNTLTYTGKCGRRPIYYAKMDQREKHDIIYHVPHYIKRKLNQRIIGGNFVRHGAYPWQARFHLMLKSGFPINISLGFHHCGGAIINQFWLIGAAHCFVDERFDKIAVIVGDHNKKIKDTGEQIFSIEEVVTHEKYDDATKDYDLALIKIRPTKNGRGIQFNNYVQPVCLPASTESFKDGMKCIVAGWGFMNPREPGDNSAPAEGYSMILKSIQVPLLSSEVCGHLYGPYNPRYNAKRMLCAGYVTGGIDSCDGDSGGPLVCKIADVYTVAGITSWGRGCAMKNMPGVYTRILAFVPWIHRTVQLHSKNNAQNTFPVKP